MINSIIKEQLKKLNIEINDSVTHIHIPKNMGDLSLTKNVPIKEDIFSKNSIIKINHNYIIKIAHYILNPPENFTLESNWNKGVRPVSPYLMGTCINQVGKMYCFSCTGYDPLSRTAKLDRYNELWLPEKSIDIISEYVD